jgi:uncharacterized membrane protein YjjP (DUF1212 family)
MAPKTSLDNPEDGVHVGRLPANPKERDAIGFILRLGKALHSYGYAAHRLEQVLDQSAVQLGLESQFFSTPTSIFASFGPQEDQRTFLIRVEPGGVDLGRLAMLDSVTIKVLHGEVSPAVGSAEIEKILESKDQYGRVITTLAFGLASAAACRFLGGGLREIGISGGIGLVIGLLNLASGRLSQLARVFEPVAAFVASLLAAVVGHWVGYSIYTATLAGLIVLVPGFTLTVAMTELSTRHLVSGTARLMGAFVLFLIILFGVALGARIATELVGPPNIVDIVPLPGWTEIVALVAAPLALRFARQGSFAGLVLAFFLAFFWQGFDGWFRAMGIAGYLEPPVAAHLTNLLFLVTGAVLMWRER